jgi:hypothetical protein
VGSCPTPAPRTRPFFLFLSDGRGKVTRVGLSYQSELPDPLRPYTSIRDTTDCSLAGRPPFIRHPNVTGGPAMRGQPTRLQQVARERESARKSSPPQRPGPFFFFFSGRIGQEQSADRRESSSYPASSSTLSPLPTNMPALPSQRPTDSSNGGQYCTWHKHFPFKRRPGEALPIYGPRLKAFHAHVSCIWIACFSHMWYDSKGLPEVECAPRSLRTQ